MKKLSKLVLSNHKEVLMNRELGQLKGGYDGDINNINTTSYCGCSFNNRGVVNNTNKEEGCLCYCA